MTQIVDARTTVSWWREASGAVADLGVLVPIAVTLIVVNGLSATAALLPAALAYLLVARVYALPVAVQPLKAFGAAAIAAGAGVEVIAAGALLMGVVFLLLGSGSLLTRAASWFPKPVIRGVQLAVALVFCKIAYGLVAHPPDSFSPAGPPIVVLLGTVALVGLLVVLRERVILPVVLLAVALSAAAAGGLTWGPSPVTLSVPGWEAFTTAAVLLVLPQLPLTFANSCIAPADAAPRYFGPAGQRVTPARLARTLGASNVLAGAIGGMPVCHGAGGMSAHYAFGARTWRAPAIMGGLLLITAVFFGDSLAAALPHFPLAVLAALLLAAAWAHARLLRDLSGRADWAVAVGVGTAGAWFNLAVAVVVGIGAAYLMRSRESEFERVC